MPSTVANARILPIAQTGFKRDIKALFASIVDDLRGILLRAAEPDGTIPVSRLNRVQAASAEIIMRLFVGPDGRNAFADDGVSPLSPYARILNKWYVYVVVAQVMAAHKWLKKTLPEDVFAYLQTGSVRSVAVVKEAANPWLRREGESDDEYRARLEALRIFSPNPLAQYEPMHTWVDPNGYRLSDRIWRTGQATRDQIDALVSAGVRQGRSAMDIAAALEAYLVPTETGIRTLRPYGPQWLPDQAAYSAMRLARTEISHANNQAAYISAANNPYCEGIDIPRSANGDPDCPICPQHATIDISGTRVRDPYPISSSPRVPPFHSHDMCSVRPAMASAAEVTQMLRGVMQDARQEYLEPYMTPARANQFIADLLGPILNQIVPQIIGGIA